VTIPIRFRVERKLPEDESIVVLDVSGVVDEESGVVRLDVSQIKEGERYSLTTITIDIDKVVLNAGGPVTLHPLSSNEVEVRFRPKLKQEMIRDKDK
jgi:hypothetical protein